MTSTIQNARRVSIIITSNLPLTRIGWIRIAMQEQIGDKSLLPLEKVWCNSFSLPIKLNSRKPFEWFAGVFIIFLPQAPFFMCGAFLI